MPVIDRTRIVDQFGENFVCLICLNLVDNPLYTWCCRQVYCKKCIGDWEDFPHNCSHMQRETLLSHQLRPVDTNFMKLYNGLRIRCENHWNGCPVITTVCQLENHQTRCGYTSSDMCRTCDLVIGEQHNCIKSLTTEMKRLRKELGELKKVLDICLNHCMSDDSATDEDCPLVYNE